MNNTLFPSSKEESLEVFYLMFVPRKAGTISININGFIDISTKIKIKKKSEQIKGEKTPVRTLKKIGVKMFFVVITPEFGGS